MSPRRIVAAANVRALIDRLPPRFRWTMHNLVAHPLSEMLFHVGMGDLGNRLHDATIPTHVRGEGRG